MKKRGFRLLAVLLSLCLLMGCSRGAAVDFRELVYERPELDRLEQSTARVERALREEAPVWVITGLLDNCYAVYDSYVTMMNLAQIRACQDVRDEYFAGELAWCRENLPLLQQGFEELYCLCGGSAVAEELEEAYFWEGFAEEYAGEGERFYNEELRELLRQEAALLAQYREGRAGLSMAEIYIRLVKLRRQQAETAGYESYAEMQFVRAYDREYTPAQADAYVESVRRELAPLYREVMAGNPYGELRCNSLSERELHVLLADASQAMGGAAAEAFRFMSRYHYYDTACRREKADLSFQSYLPAVQAPFLFLDAHGDTEDFLSFAHEFGHYTDAWANGDAYENMDASECFSQAMEYLVLKDLPEAEREDLRRRKLLDTLELYVQQASFHAFEQAVYAAEQETLSEDFLNTLFLELARDYGYYDGQGGTDYASSWWEVPHFFEAPFYVISYPLSNDLALQIYELELREKGSGLAAFERMLTGPHANLSQAVENAGLLSPFAPQRAESQAEFLIEQLQELGLKA